MHIVPIPVTMALANIPKHRELKMPKKKWLIFHSTYKSVLNSWKIWYIWMPKIVIASILFLPLYCPKLTKKNTWHLRWPTFAKKKIQLKQGGLNCLVAYDYSQPLGHLWFRIWFKRKPDLAGNIIILFGITHSQHTNPLCPACNWIRHANWV